MPSPPPPCSSTASVCHKRPYERALLGNFSFLGQTFGFSYKSTFNFNVNVNVISTLYLKRLSFRLIFWSFYLNVDMYPTHYLKSISKAMTLSLSFRSPKTYKQVKPDFGDYDHVDNIFDITVISVLNTVRISCMVYVTPDTLSPANFGLQ